MTMKTNIFKAIYIYIYIFPMQCLKDKINEIYMDDNYSVLDSYYGTNCANATNIPCWIPQIKDHIVTQDGLNKCRTIMDLNCELGILYSGLEERGRTCTKPCQSWKYKLSSRKAKLKSTRVKEVCKQKVILPSK